MMKYANKIRPNALIIIRHNNFVLASPGKDTTKKEEFYRLLGGGIEMGELSYETIKREIKEEINGTIINEKFLRVIENIYEYDSQKGHEITFLFEGDIQEDSLYNEKRIRILDKTEEAYAEWVPIDKIKNNEVTLYPREAVEYL